MYFQEQCSTISLWMEFPKFWGSVLTNDELCSRRVRELTYFWALSLTPEFSESYPLVKKIFFSANRPTFPLLICTKSKSSFSHTASQGTFRKSKSVPDVTVPDVTKYPLQTNHLVCVITHEISKFCLKHWRLVFTLGIKPVFINISSFI